MAAPEVERRMAAILVADIVGYSRLVEIDEARTLTAVKNLRREIIDPLLASCHGRIVKLLGDGLLAEFASVVDAVSCAVEVQKETAARQVDVSPERRIVFRIGVNLGDVVVEDGDLFGDGVNVAARLEQLCQPGDVLISGTVYDHLQGKLDLPLHDAGSQHVKNIARPVRTYRVRLDGSDRPWRFGFRRHAAGPGWAAALIAVAFAAGAYWYAFSLPDALAVRDRSPTPISVAVLPFNDMNRQADLAYVSEGVAEDIISMLSRVPDLAVVARSSSFTFKGQPVDVRKVGKELGVTHVLEVGVRKDADRMRIVAQLVDARTGEHAWAERFDRTGTDPWALQDEVTERIVAALVGETGTLKKAQYGEAWGKDSTSLGEYDYYLRGHERFMQFKPESHEQALEIWTEGLKKFPQSGLLKIKIGWAYFSRGWSGWSADPNSDYRRAGSLVREAMAQPALSPMARRLGHWLSAFVDVSEQKFEWALSEAEAAIALSPYDAFMLHDLSQIPIMAGKPAQALEWLERAESVDPNPQALPWLAAYRGWALLVDGRLEESLAALSEARSPKDTVVFIPTFRAIVLNRLGRTGEAAAELKKARDIDPAFTQAKWRTLNFYSDPGILDREISDLASLGLP